MKYPIIAIIGIVVVVILAGTVLSQGKRGECLVNCRAQGDACAQQALETHAACRAEPIVCESEKIAALRACQSDYDVCRWECDAPPY